MREPYEIYTVSRMQNMAQLCNDAYFVTNILCRYVFGIFTFSALGVECPPVEGLSICLYLDVQVISYICNAMLGSSFGFPRLDMFPNLAHALFNINHRRVALNCVAPQQQITTTEQITLWMCLSKSEWDTAKTEFWGIGIWKTFV